MADEEELARFLTSSNQFKTSFVRQSVFLPSRDNETSVFRHGLEPLKELRALGKIATGDRTLYGAAIIRASVVRNVGLEVLADELPERHAVICSWPQDKDEFLQKAKQKELALLLASSAGAPILF